VRLFLIRHPQPAVAAGVCYGRTDLALAEDAAVVAERLRPLLPADVPVWSSPLRRCRELAAALHAAPLVDTRLIEMDFGAWEMQSWDSIGRAALDGWAADPLGFAPPRGESAGDLLRRAGEFHEHLATSGYAQAALVTHAGIIKALCGLGERLPAGEWMRLAFEFGSVTVIEGGRRVANEAAQT
jgi:alpha-ribazole phosphatase